MAGTIEQRFFVHTTTSVLCFSWPRAKTNATSKASAAPSTWGLWKGGTEARCLCPGHGSSVEAEMVVNFPCAVASREGEVLVYTGRTCVNADKRRPENAVRSAPITLVFYFKHYRIAN